MKITNVSPDGSHRAVSLSRSECYELISKLTGHLAGVGGGGCPTFICSDGELPLFRLSFVLEPDPVVPPPPPPRDTEATVEEPAAAAAVRAPKPKVQRTPIDRRAPRTVDMTALSFRRKTQPLPDPDTDSHPERP